jgi:outer membrane protein
MKENPLTPRLFPRVFLAFIVGAMMLVSAQAQNKIGLIDLEKVFENYWKKKQANALLDERKAEFTKSRKGMIDDYQKANEEYKKLIESASDQAVSSEEREKRKTAAEKKLVEIKSIEQEVNQHDRNSAEILGTQTRRMRDKILDEIRELINAKAKAGGYTLVLDTAAKTVNLTPVLLYHNGQNDMTEEVLKELNANAPTTDAKPEEPEKKATKGAGEKKEDKE